MMFPSSATSTNNNNNNSPEEGEWTVPDFPSFEELLQRVPEIVNSKRDNYYGEGEVQRPLEYPDLTKELRQHGRIVNYMTETPEEREIERNCLEQLRDVRRDAEEDYKRFLSRINLIKPGKPHELMEMSFETVVKILEHTGGKDIGNFGELLEAMEKLSGANLNDLIAKEHCKSFSSDENDMFSPNSMMSGKAPSSILLQLGHSHLSTAAPTTPIPFSLSNSIRSMSKVPSHVFPTASEMVHNNPLMTPLSTPANSVFRFGSTASSIMSSNKAPRLLKPGEIAFSQSGSPLMLPKLGGFGFDKKGERIPVNDADGKKIVEVVVYKGDDGKDKEYKDFVTDIRGLVATKSIKKNRILPPRVVKAGGGPLGFGSSAKKMPNPR